MTSLKILLVDDGQFRYLDIINSLHKLGYAVFVITDYGEKR